MNADELFDKAVELFEESKKVEDHEIRPKLAQALHFVNEALKLARQNAWGLGFKSLLLFNLGNLTEAVTVADKALLIDPYDWGARMTQFRFQIRKDSVAGAIGGLNHLLESFEHHFDSRNVETNLERATMLVEYANLLIREKIGGMILFGGWKHTPTKILSKVMKLLGTLSSEDEVIEAKLREVEVTASGYLELLK